MKNLSVNLAIFALFFGVSAIEAIQTQDWLRVAFWLAIGLVFLWAGLKKD